MTAADIIDILLAANLAGGVSIAAVLALRGAIRRLVGAQVTYLSWLAVPAIVFACLLPARVDTIQAQPPAIAAVAPVPAPIIATRPVTLAVPAARSAALPTPIAFQPTPISQAKANFEIDWRAGLAFVWITGAIGWLGFLFLRQTLAVRALGALNRVSDKISRAMHSNFGPAVVGILSPRIVLPDNFEEAFNEIERKVVLAHEEAHLRGRHTAVKTVVEIVVCLNWFNPLVHIAARAITMDQELACDEAVVRLYPGHKKTYAAVLLRSQQGPRAPLGCYWPAGSAHALKTRIEQIRHKAAGRKRRFIGCSFLALLAAGAAGAAWGSKPPQTRVVTAERQIFALAPQAVAPHTAPPAAAPQPVRFDEPQQKPEPPAPSGMAAFDPADPVYLRGKVERIDFSETNYTVFVRTSSLATSEFDEPKADTRLWALTPTPFWGDRDTVNADLMDSYVLVRGYNATDKSCRPACKLLTRGIVVPKPTALAAPALSTPFGVSEVMRAYDMDQAYSIEGRVQRIEFSERTFDAYVETAAIGIVPGRVFQVRSEYRIPRAEIEKELNNQVIRVKGWPARSNINMDIDMWSIYSNCDSLCAMYGTDLTREDGAKIAPAGDQLMPTPLSTDPFLARLPSMARRDAGVVLTGKVKEARTHFGVELVVEETSRSPAAFSGPQPGTVWTVWFGPPAGVFGWSERTDPLNTIVKARSMVGHTITFSGTSGPNNGATSNVRTCRTNCKFKAENIMTFD